MYLYVCLIFSCVNYLVKETSCSIIQKILCKSSTEACIESRISTPEVPHGEGFIVKILLKLSKVSTSKTRVKVVASFEWKKGLWMLKSKLYPHLRSINRSN